MTVPAAPVPASGQRAPRFLSPSTRSLAFDVLYGAQPTATTIADVVAGAPHCDPVAGGGVSCLIDITVSSGATGLIVRAFDAIGGGGSLLGSQSVAVPAGTGIVDVFVTLGGHIRALSLSIAGGAFSPGVAETRAVVLIARDADNNVIAGDFDAPVQLATSDDAVKLAPAPGAALVRSLAVGSATTNLIATYDGTATAKTILSANAGSTSAAATVAILAVGTVTPSPSASPSPAPSASPSPAPSASPSPSATPVAIRIHGYRSL
ncbi:MAG: hypothetical protein NVSMB64_10040 [Candidatus Velthaea sp.]